MHITTDHGQAIDARDAADRADVPRRRGQRGAVLHLRQHAGQRHHARPQHHAGDGREQRGARRRTAGGTWWRRRGRAWRSGRAVGSRARRLRVRLHAARSRRIPTSSGRPATATKSRATTRGTRTARSCQPVDAYARLAADRQPSTAATGPPPLAIDPFDSQHGLLRLPGDLRDHERRPELEGDQPGPFHQGSESRSSRPAASSATTSASSTARWSSRSRPRRSRAA